jgi:hypothetical protein
LIGNFFNITPYVAAVRPAFSAAHAGNMRDMVLLFRFPYAVEQAQRFLILGVLDNFSFHHNSFCSFSVILPLRFGFTLRIPLRLKSRVPCAYRKRNQKLQLAVSAHDRIRKSAASPHAIGAGKQIF